MRKKILIVITGSIAAYKALYLIRKLKEKYFFVNVIMTNSAKSSLLLYQFLRFQKREFMKIYLT